MTEFRLSTSPAFRLALLVVAGILLACWCAVPSRWLFTIFAASLAVAGTGFLLSRRYPAVSVATSAAVLLVCLIAGALKYALDSDRSAFLSGGSPDHDVVVVGTVVEPPHVVGKTTRFLLTTQFVKDAGSQTRVGETVRVSVTRPKGEMAVPPVGYGMTLALRGRISRPRDSRNPGEFSEKQYFEANGITLFMLVRGGSNIAVLDSTGGNWLLRNVAAPARDYVIRLVNETTGGESREFLKGLLIGERSGITPSTREAFTNSGVAHVLAVSGSNVVVVAAVFFFLFGMLRLPRWGVAALSILALVVYMLVTGSQPPVVRATVIAGIFLVGGVVQAKPNPYNSLGAAALVILAADARQLFDVGFQLSFVAVLSIIFLYPEMTRWLPFRHSTSVAGRTAGWVLRVCAVSLAATLGTLPLTAVYFGKVSVIGLLANIVVIPSVGASVVLGFVMIFAGLFGPWLAQTYAAVNQVLLDVTLRVIQVCGDTRFASVDASRFLPVYAFPFYAGLLLLGTLRKRNVAKKMTVVFLLALNLAVVMPAPAATAAAGGKLRVTFLDVGQGDAAVAEFPDGHTLVLDTGPRSDQYDAGERVVAPFLRRRGISTIDLLILSHPHDDHIGGAPYLLEHFTVRRVLESPQSVDAPLFRILEQDLRGEQCVVDTARKGVCLKMFEECRIYVLSPSPDATPAAHDQSSLNDASIVTQIRYKDVSFLFAGDVGQDVEEEMVRQYGSFLHSTLLKVGHHGSLSSSSVGFLDVVHPDYTVVSVGLWNRFGHPSAEVLDRLRRLPSEVCRTDEDGAVMFESDGNVLSRVDWR